MLSPIPASWLAILAISANSEFDLRDPASLSKVEEACRSIQPWDSTCMLACTHVYVHTHVQHRHTPHACEQWKKIRAKSYLKNFKLSFYYR